MYADAVLSVFSQRYSGARDKFISAVETSSIVEKLTNFAHPLKGPKNEKLFCDVAWAGNLKAKNVLVLVSGLHGVEGGVGSAIQSDFIGRHRRLPSDICVLLIHAINPWGFAYASRNDHEGIDVNRNFIDFDAAKPDSSKVMEAWQQIRDGKTDFATVGMDRAQFDLLTQGQYEDPNTPYFGGSAASWSRQTIEQVVGQLKPDKRDRVLVIDIHSGLGAYGFGELISDHPVDSPANLFARKIFGTTLTEPALGNSSSGPKHGLHDYYWQQQGDHVTFLTLEFGTFSGQEMLSVLSADLNLHQQAKVDWTDQKTLDIKHAMQDFFCPDQKQWQELVLFRGRQVIEMAMDALSETTAGGR